ncbi:MAG: GNAT family protein [Candidatus Pacearchaeota archaeon]
MRIITKRLILRPLKNSDAKSIVENINDLKVSKWLLVVPYPYNLRDAKKWIKETQCEWKKRNKKEYVFGIELKEEKKVIGGIGIHKVDRFQRKAKVKYWLGRKYWNKGYGSEALKAVLEFAFKKLKLRRIEAGVFVGNIPSKKLLEKFGAKIEGIRRKSYICKADKKIKDEYVYGLLKEEFFSNKK